MSSLATTIHNPASVPAPVGNYALALGVPSARRLVFVSGQVPERLDGSIPSEFADQCRLVWAHVKSCLEEAGLSLDHVVKVTTFLTRIGDADVNSVIRREILGAHQPALTVMVATTLDPRWLIELEVIAAE
jgi:enamine deaminase RidA (YjgF/YER057c/UK114 family)